MSTTTIQIGSDQHQLTPWLPGSEQPLREGVYRRQFPAGPYSCWRGDRWMQDANTPAAAAAQVTKSPHQGAAWRGLATPAGMPGIPSRSQVAIDRGLDPETGRDLPAECEASLAPAGP